MHTHHSPISNDKHEWGTSDNNRKARFYKLTRNGRKELTREATEWRRIATAIARILGPTSTKA